MDPQITQITQISRLSQLPNNQGVPEWEMDQMRNAEWGKTNFQFPCVS
jgi:hypothetical protein